ncbi:hypothetical protein OHA25_08505 [Nonomuraea sp. NBC_00507]|uniref:hypothetical protein n=1 Tax=Nonomuraea sp. NBC_00507 TaxID=2976002 RepID=UPI002E17BE42
MTTSRTDTPTAAAAAAPVYLTREQILGVDDRQFEDVPVPEWGGTVRVRGLQGNERDRWETSLLDKKNQIRENPRAKLVQLCIIDERGQLLFSREDISALGRKSAAALSRVFEVAQRLSGLTDADMEELEGE